MKRPRIVRKNNRIYFGEGENEWSVCDPEWATESHALAVDWTWLVTVCPTTVATLEKVRLIRWAVRNVKVSDTRSVAGDATEVKP